MKEEGEIAEVIELLPNATVKLKLLLQGSSEEAVVLAHAAGAAEKNFMRLRPGDRVRVKLSTRDKTRGRILELLS
ncbi:MAG: translation initiation factor IF-1 [Acidobacteriota bacterium]